MSAFLKVGVSAAILAASTVGIPSLPGPLGVSEAQARDWHRHRRHHDDFDLGDAIVGAAVVGGLIAVLSAANDRDREERRYPDDRRYPNDRGWDDRDWGWSGGSGDERAAVDTCAREAEYLGGRYGDEARVRRIDGVDLDGGEYRVRGEVQVYGPRDDRDDRYDEDRRAFTCYARGDRVVDFRFEDGVALR